MVEVMYQWTAAEARAEEAVRRELARAPVTVRPMVMPDDDDAEEPGNRHPDSLVGDRGVPGAPEPLGRQLMADQLRRGLDDLSPREAAIMAMRFGLFDGNPHTVDEIGKRLGLSREQVRQLEERSLSKLRHPSRARTLPGLASRNERVAERLLAGGMARATRAGLWLTCQIMALDWAHVPGRLPKVA